MEAAVVCEALHEVVEVIPWMLDADVILNGVGASVVELDLDVAVDDRCAAATICFGTLMRLVYFRRMGITARKNKCTHVRAVHKAMVPSPMAFSLKP